MYVCMHTSLHAYTTGSDTHLVDRYRMICCITVLSRFSVLLSSDTTKNLGLRPRQKKTRNSEKPKKEETTILIRELVGIVFQGSGMQAKTTRENEKKSCSVGCSRPVYLSICLSVCLSAILQEVSIVG